METIENNKLIAEFMGLETTLTHKGIKQYYQREYNSGMWYEEHELRYHLSWDWLMPVGQKCYKIDDEEGFDNMDWVYMRLVDAVSTLNLNSIYQAVVEFIKYHNEEKKLNDMETIENNKLIAEFMGDGKEYEVDINTKTLKSYNTSWDWLMPVIGKISDLCEEPQELDSLKYSLLSADIKTANYQVVEFIKYLNEEKN